MRTKFVWTMIVSLVVPMTIHADDNPAPIVRDANTVQLKNIELSESGELIGQFVNKAGLPLLGRDIYLEQQDHREAIKISDNGTFRIGGLKTGTVVFRAEKDTFACRVWQHGTAPPNALKSLALVSSDEIVLGQLTVPGILPLPNLPMVPVPNIPFPNLPLPNLPFAGSLGLGSTLGVGVIVAGGAGVAIAVSQDKDNASL